MAHKTTIYQVAAQAGVSISTVSKVLSNKSGVSSAARLKVLEASKNLGYIPSLAARSLPGGQTGIVGLLIPYSPTQFFADPHLLNNMYGIETVLSELNYNLLLATARDRYDPTSSYKRLLEARYFDGVIVMETHQSSVLELHQLIANQNRPWVILGYPAGITPCYAVYSDDFQGGQMAAEHLVALGHRRIGLVNANPRPSAFDERIRGFTRVMKANHLELDSSLVVDGDMTQESGYKIAAKLLERPDRPTAIFSLNDRMAFGLITWAQENGMRIPADLSVVGFDDIPLAQLSCPQLTTIRQPAVQMGKEAANLLFRLLKADNPPSRIVTATELIIRQTTTQPSGEL